MVSGCTWSGEAAGERAKTGTEESWSSGIRISAKQRRQTSWEHMPHLHTTIFKSSVMTNVGLPRSACEETEARLHAKEADPSLLHILLQHSTAHCGGTQCSTLRLLSSGRASSSALVRTDRMWTTSAMLSSSVCRAPIHWSCGAAIVWVVVSLTLCTVWLSAISFQCRRKSVSIQATQCIY